MLLYIIMILLDVVMVALNFNLAKKEQDRGRKGLEITFTIFAVLWIVFLGFDIISLASLVFGG